MRDCEEFLVEEQGEKQTGEDAVSWRALEKGGSEECGGRGSEAGDEKETAGEVRGLYEEEGGRLDGEKKRQGRIEEGGMTEE